MECKCTMSQSVLGDGCEKCNPAYALERYKETIEDLEAEVAELEVQNAELVADRERLDWLDKWGIHIGTIGGRIGRIKWKGTRNITIRQAIDSARGK